MLGMAQSLSERINELRQTPVWKLKKPGQHTTRLEHDELERRWQALDLRKSGASYSQIAKALHIGATTAREDVLWAFDQVFQEPAAEARQLELERLDAMQLAIWQKAVKGEYAAIDRVLKIMAQRERILGIDTPENPADINFILQMAHEISEQLGIPVEDIVREAEYIAKREWLEGQYRDQPQLLDGELVEPQSDTSI